MPSGDAGHVSEVYVFVCQVPLPVVLPSAPSGSQSKDTHDPLVQSQGIAEEVEEVEKGKPVSHGGKEN